MLGVAQTDTRADKIREQKWYTVYKDHITSRTTRSMIASSTTTNSKSLSSSLMFFGMVNNQLIEGTLTWPVMRLLLLCIEWRVMDVERQKFQRRAQETQRLICSEDGETAHEENVSAQKSLKAAAVKLKKRLRIVAELYYLLWWKQERVDLFEETSEDILEENALLASICGKEVG